MFLISFVFAISFDCLNFLGFSFQCSNLNLNCLLGSQKSILKSPQISQVSKFALLSSKKKNLPFVSDYLPNTILSPNPNLFRRKLDNGFKVLFLPNSTPKNRFEVHLEVLSGSVHELSHQQGMAHLLEHVVYMGSPKRQLLIGTGSKTNAYTDFQHTVFFASCPTHSGDLFRTHMLPLALDALLDVLTTRVTVERLEKERCAVLSEASMVNSMEYRVECQLLTELHRENRMSTRLPIGREEQIRGWGVAELQQFHDVHYRPDNAVLYVAGDLSRAELEAQVEAKFGWLEPAVDSRQWLAASGEWPRSSMRDANRHFPPTVHRWACSKQHAALFLPPQMVSPQLPPQDLLKISLPVVSYQESSEDNKAAEDFRPALFSPDQNDNSGSSSQSSLQIKYSPKLVAKVEATIPEPKIFSHELLQCFSFHLFAKRPIEPITTLVSLKREIMRRMIVSCMQIRLNIFQRENPIFTFIDFNQLNWPRDGCAVCSLDLSTPTSSWKDGVFLAIQELRRMGIFGLSPSELRRYGEAYLQELSQSIAQQSQIPSIRLVEELMENTANGHTPISADEKYIWSQAAVESISLADIKEMAKELCEHVSHINSIEGVQPSAIIACTPTTDHDGKNFSLTSKEVAEVIEMALQSEVAPLDDSIIPTTLLTPQQLEQKFLETPPHFAPLGEKVIEAVSSEERSLRQRLSLPPFDNSTNSDKKLEKENQDIFEVVNESGVVQKRLSNGLRVNLLSTGGEALRVNARVLIPGGRVAGETQNKPGSILLASKTIQEGGACLGLSREEVEMFCLDHSLSVEVVTNQDNVCIELSATTSVGLGGHLSGLEALMQVIHILLTDFTWEETAFARASHALREDFDKSTRSLEGLCLHTLIQKITKDDRRYSLPLPSDLSVLSLDEVRGSFMSLLTPEKIEISVAGGAPLDELEALTLKYLGTIPKTQVGDEVKTKLNSQNRKTQLNESLIPIEEFQAWTGKDSKEKNVVANSNIEKSNEVLEVYLQDTDERAMGYIAGEAPNRWGVFSDGRKLTDIISQHHKEYNNSYVVEVEGEDEDFLNEKEIHPLYGTALLEVLNEAVNSRLFTVVREERQLTYDASFSFKHGEMQKGGWYLVSVTSSPEIVRKAVQACRDALTSLTRGDLYSSIQSAVRSIQSRLKNEEHLNKFWIEVMSGSQLNETGEKSVKLMTEYFKVLEKVNSRDLLFTINLLKLADPNSQTTCIGIGSPTNTNTNLPN